MVVDVSYISKEHSDGVPDATRGVTGILAVQAPNGSCCVRLRISTTRSTA